METNLISKVYTELLLVTASTLRVILNLKIADTSHMNKQKVIISAMVNQTSQYSN